ncbi:type II secretion system inner membrane protein GspF [Pseudomonas sp. dw_358]|uniref:type II secretion system inner membrane protein GspF n=1 Tax=Pseudomonas sp. dw_358 TaxID=2720083 RepID=UPI001BD21735|nr:type II secretion system inner membrane protein GspF [Pseudomonas sp. dw_358]
MTQYRYRALDAAGRREQGAIEAASQDAATTLLQARGLIIMEVGPAQASSGTGLRRLFKRGPLNSRQLVQFTHQLATLLGASQPLDKSLLILQSQPGNLPGGALVTRVRNRVKDGRPLSLALAEETGQFTPLYLSMVKAGEAGGRLGDTLKQLALYLERAQALKGEVTNALIYPAFLLVGVLGSLVLLMAYVVPQFIPIFDGLGVPVPLITQSVLRAGQFLGDFGLYLLIGGIAVGMTVTARFREPAARLRWDRRVLHSRGLGQLLQLLETARLARTLGTLLSQGVPLLTALGIGRQVCNNRAVQSAVDQASTQVKNGGTLSVALAIQGVLPDLALQMIEVGEESGQLDVMLLKVAEVFDTEAKRNIDRLLAALVPSLTLVMAALVAFIMLAIMLPLMSLTSNI